MSNCRCGKPITIEGALFCQECYVAWKAMKQAQGEPRGNRQQHASAPQAPAGDRASLPSGYLAGGYYNDIDGKRYLREEIFLAWAQKAAAALKTQRPPMSASALRRFYNKLKAQETRFGHSGDFEQVRVGLFSLERDVAYSSKRQVIPQLFQQFIEKNVALAKEGPEAFKGFMEHYQSVVAYFPEK